MNEYFNHCIKEASGAGQIFQQEIIQELWSGYGQISRFALQDAERKTVVVKHVRLPENEKHPRGWNTNISHQRKIKSYQVETAWYTQYSQISTTKCRMPQCLAVETQGDEVLMVLEDLNESGFPVRKNTINWPEMEACIKWLANFHAVYMQTKPIGLWETGTYWHLETRSEELEALDDFALKNAAERLDSKLKSARYQTLVHGDAKLANFCFSENGMEVAAVDFQYVGGGCGMKDLAYFVGSCLNEKDCERLESDILKVYFSELKTALTIMHPEINTEEVEKEGRNLYPVAWTDFHRFLKGWSPGHWKINDYSERLAQKVITDLTLEQQ